MLKTCVRFFRIKTPLFEASHRVTLPKAKSIIGTSQRSDRQYDPTKMKKLQSLVKDQVYTPGISLSDSVKKLAKTDKEFNDFLKNFKAKGEPEWSSLLDSPANLDLKSYLKDPKRKTQDRLDELYMHDQLRKKKAAETLYAEHTLRQDDHEYDRGEMDGSEPVKSDGAIYRNSDVKYRDIGEDVFLNAENFKILFIEAGGSTNITKLARVNSRNVLLYMGNTDGVIGYGRGKGFSYQIAFDMAVDQCKKNLICINIDHFMTTPGYLTGHYNDTTLKIYPAPQGTSWGHPLYYNILALAGLTSFRFKIFSRNVNKYALIYCFFQCLTKNTTPRIIAQRSGEKIYQMTYGRGMRRDYNPSLFNV